MAISNELSSDIAAAILAAREKHPGNVEELKRIVFQVHSTLQRLTDESRRGRIMSDSFLDKTNGDQ